LKLCKRSPNTKDKKPSRLWFVLMEFGGDAGYDRFCGWDSRAPAPDFAGTPALLNNSPLRGGLTGA
jgi:hypothetical protein